MYGGFDAWVRNGFPTQPAVQGEFGAASVPWADGAP